MLNSSLTTRSEINASYSTGSPLELELLADELELEDELDEEFEDEVLADELEFVAPLLSYEPLPQEKAIMTKTTKIHDLYNVIKNIDRQRKKATSNKG